MLVLFLLCSASCDYDTPINYYIKIIFVEGYLWVKRELNCARNANIEKGCVTVNTQGPQRDIKKRGEKS